MILNSAALNFIAAASLALLAAAIQPPPASAQETTVGTDNQTNIGLTIYNGNLAFVRDTRTVPLSRGLNRIAFEDVSARIQAETAALTGAPFTLIEQNFDFDLLSPEKLIEKAVGGQVRIYRENPATGEDTVERATVLAANNGVVLQFDDRIEYIGARGMPGRLVFEEIPENLRARPTLSVTLDSARSTSAELQLSYLTGGLTWRADYVATLARDEKSLSLQGWVTLTNTSGAPYRDALVQLVAGDVNRVSTPGRPERAVMTMRGDAAAAVPQEEGLLEYHLYTVPHRTTIAQNQTKQVNLLEAPEVKVDKRLEVRHCCDFYRAMTASDWVPAKLYLDFENDDRSGLGMPLPRGIVRVYMPDSAGQNQFVGEDSIDHTPEGRDVELFLGNSFDVTAKHTQTAFEERKGRDQDVYTTSWEVELKNAKDSIARVHLVEEFGDDWEILDESAGHERANAGAASWNIDIPAKGTVTLNYTVRIERDY